MKRLSWLAKKNMAYNNTTHSEAPPCMACQSPMVLREKDGSKFWGCPNWKECGGRTMPYGKPALAKVPQDEAKKIFATEVFRRLDEISAKLDELLLK